MANPWDNDPIVKAAIEMRDKANRRNAALDGPVPMWVVPIIDAVNEAGL